MIFFVSLVFEVKESTAAIFDNNDITDNIHW